MKNKLIKVVSSVLLCQFILVACGNTKTTETDIDESLSNAEVSTEAIDENNNEESAANSSSESNTTSEEEKDDIEYIDANDSDKELIVKELELSKNDTVVPAQVGSDSYIMYFYNDNNEVLIKYTEQSCEVIRNDGKAIRADIDNSITAVGSDCDLFKMIENAVKSDNENVKVYKDSTHDYTDTAIYLIEMTEEEGIKTLWSSVDSEKIDYLYSNFIGDNTIEDIGNKLYIKIQVNTDKTANNEPLVSKCYYTMNNEEYTIWYQYNVVTIPEWKLYDEWYEDMSEKDGDYIAELIANQYADLITSVDNSEKEE